MLQKVKNRLKEQKGFTLIELLAVIVILGIIAAIAVPAIGNIINDSKKEAAINDALQIINAAKLSRAAGDTTTTWTSASNDLADYLTDASDFTSVSIDETTGVFTITGHVGIQLITSGPLSDGEATEAELKAELASS